MTAGVARADGVQTLRPGATALRRNIQLAMTPVRRHLPAAVRGSSFEPTDASSISNGVMPSARQRRAIAIVGEEPVVPGSQVHACRHENRFVPAPLIWKNAWLWFLS
jgi:hypothetical protein